MKDASREALTTLTNLPHCGKVVFTKVGCDRFNGKPSRVAAAPAVSSMLAPIVNHHYDRLTTRKAIWTVLKTWSIGSISDSIGLDGFGAKACGGSQGFSISMIG
jgi:hypothetical protein